jgi:putative ABC transport system permease protein
LNETLKEGGRGAGGSVGRNRLRNSLVVLEVALSLLLLVGASLFVRSFLELQRADAGFDTKPLLTLRIYLPAGVYADGDEAAMTRRVDDVVRRLEAIPGVESVTASNTIPLGSGGGEGDIQIEGQPAERGHEPRIFYTGVTPHFFRTLAVALQSGRGFTDQEGITRSGVAIVNQSFARRFWPDREAVGRRFQFVNTEQKPEWITVIGVTPDLRNDDVDDPVVPSAYLPYPYLVTRNTGLTLRTRLAPETLTPLARKEIHASDPNLPIFDVNTMDAVRELGYWEYRFFGKMFSSFGLMALFLAAIGVYGVLSYSVSQRWREIGVRVALGAQRGQVVRLVVRQGMNLALAGIALGLLGSFGVTRIVASILYNVSATDPLSFGGISVLLAAVAAFASYLPASRAMEVDPLDALRAE